MSYLYCIDRLVKTLGNDFPATALVWVWISCIHPCLNCLSHCIRMVYEHGWRSHKCTRELLQENHSLKFWLSYQYNTNMTRLFIIRLVLSHIDHCEIKIKKKKKLMNFYVKMKCVSSGKNISVRVLKSFPPATFGIGIGKEFPALHWLATNKTLGNVLCSNWHLTTK